MSDRYDYEIRTEKLIPPIGGTMRYAANLLFMVRLKEGGGSVKVNPGLGEVWGTTEQEARDKMTKAVKEWIAGRAP